MFRVATVSAGDGRSPLSPYPVPDNGTKPTVWISASLAETELRSYFHLLAFDEIARSRALKLAGDRERFLTGRLLLRLALTLTVANGLHPSAWRFSAGRFGKPEVCAGHPHIYFNVSHAARMVAVAIDPLMPIGVDIEPLDGLSLSEMPGALLSARERSALERCDEQTRAREFVRLWTLKEAHVKRSGLGVHLDFASFNIDWQPGRDAQVIETGDEILETRPIPANGDAYQVSVALEGHQRAVSWREVGVAQLARALAQ